MLKAAPPFVGRNCPSIESFVIEEVRRAGPPEEIVVIALGAILRFARKSHRPRPIGTRTETDAPVGSIAPIPGRMAISARRHGDRPFDYRIANLIF